MNGFVYVVYIYYKTCIFLRPVGRSNRDFYRITVLCFKIQNCICRNNTELVNLKICRIDSIIYRRTVGVFTDNYADNSSYVGIFIYLVYFTGDSNWFLNICNLDQIIGSI